MYHNKSVGRRNTYAKRKIQKIFTRYFLRYRNVILTVLLSLVAILLVYALTVYLIYSPRYKIVAVDIIHGTTSTAQKQDLTVRIQSAFLDETETYPVLRYVRQG
jgi:Ca2+/Na+ antiporter